MLGNIRVIRPGVSNFKCLIDFFNLVIKDTFMREGLEDLFNDMEEEVKTKITYLTNDFNSDGNDRYFLIALDDDQIIGTIEHGPASELITQNTTHLNRNLTEVGTVFVHPKYQRKGIGNKLLNEMYLTLKSKGIEEFWLDCGYSISQKIWQKKYGEPDYLLKNYWGDGAHHMIWNVNVTDK